MGKKRTNKANANPWPDRVRALLARYDLTHEQLGARFGVSRQNVSDFINGRRIPPRCIQKLMAMMEEGDDLSRFEKI